MDNKIKEKYKKQVTSMDVITVYKGGLDSPQKATTFYKNQIKWRLFLYCEPEYLF